MITTVEDFVMAWSNETAATQKVMDLLTDASLGQEIAPNYRSLGQLGWHLATTIHEMLSRTGLVFNQLEGDEAAPASASVIAEGYRNASKAALEAVQNQWTDADLARSSMMYGEEWPNSLTLDALIKHEIHHRGQMTVLMRQAGLSIPGIYGPTREEWIEQGLQPHI